MAPASLSPQFLQGGNPTAWHLVAGCFDTYSFTFTLRMTRASSQNVGKLFSDCKSVHRESFELLHTAVQLLLPS